ncbi:MAG: hypothetical protein K0R57_4464 [Paenibacillaceae bacterium]|jgi:hypothetical protein|nr:hypothetical protein [Paenibacillaceae bacterium]
MEAKWLKIGCVEHSSFLATLCALTASAPCSLTKSRAAVRMSSFVSFGYGGKGNFSPLEDNI